VFSLVIPGSPLTPFEVSLTRYLHAGGVTFTGSIVAFLKLAGRMSSKPLVLPGRHLVNTSLLTANVATMGAFVTMAPGAPMVAAACLGANTVLSFLKGYTTTAAIGGADMRTHSKQPHDLHSLGVPTNFCLPYQPW
jgi:NAD/NADP transhydrogenase beta subunit